MSRAPASADRRSRVRAAAGSCGGWRFPPLVLWSLVVAGSAAAQEPPPATPAELREPVVRASTTDATAEFRAALARAPAIAAARARLLAALGSRGAAGVLPDPILGLDAGRRRQRSAGTMTMYGVSIEQPLPRWGARDAERLGAEAMVQVAQAEFATLVGDHAAAIASAQAESEAAQESLAWLDGTRDRLVAVAEVVRSRLASGGGMLGESLAIETRRQQLDLQRTELVRRADDAETEIRGRLGLSPTTGLPTVAWPDPLAIQVAGAPAVQLAQAAVVQAQAEEHQALARGRPETSVGVIWEREAARSDDQSDQVSVAVTVSLPIWRGAYDAACDVARARARAATHEVAGAGWMARSQVARAQRASEQAHRAEVLAEAITRRSETEFAAVIRQAASGTASLTVVLDLLDRVSEARLQAVEARLASRVALAGLWRIAPPPLALDDIRDDVESTHQGMPP